MTGRSHRHAGLTLGEVLVALSVLALAGAALASVQLGALRSGRTAQVRQIAADGLAKELLYQRVGPAAASGACVAAALPAAWTCSVTTSCPVALAGCQLQVIQVVVVPPESDALGGTAVRYDPLVGEP